MAADKKAAVLIKQNSDGSDVCGVGRPYQRCRAHQYSIQVVFSSV